MISGKYRFSLFLILAVVPFFPIQAQPKPFGEVDVSDFSSYSSEYDSTMSAVILFEHGTAEFLSDYNVEFEFHKRLKILSDEGLEYADIVIPYFDEKKKSVYSIEANTYVLSENGEIEIYPLDTRDTFESDIDEGVSFKKFAMPAAAVGVIIEYRYKRNMGNPVYLPNWKFHDYIPVNWSEYNIYIPQGLNYSLVFKGNDSLYVNETERILNKFTPYGDWAYHYRLAKKDLPAVEDLPYLLNRDDHISEVYTQLTGIRIPGYVPGDFFQEWEDIAKDLNDLTGFGRQRLNKTMRDEVERLTSEDSSEVEKIESIYNYVVENFEWNGSRRIVTGKGIRDTFKDKTGNSADINIMFAEMLRAAGINTNLGLLSTRDNGTVLTDYSLVDQFNMVVVVVEIEEGAFMLDATSKFRSFRNPRPSLLYRNIFVIREDDSYGWLLSTPMDKATQRLSLTYTIDDSDEMQLDYEGILQGEYAEVMRSEVSESNPQDFWESSLGEVQGLSIDSIEFGNLIDYWEPLTFNAKLSVLKEEQITEGTELVYIQPFMFLKMEENPFKKTTREFPIEISYPYRKQFLINIAVPEGYLVDEMPESVSIILPERSGHYRFMSGKNGNIINIVSDISVSTLYYSPEEYQQVKEMFQKILDTQNAMVVLKKESTE